MTFLTFSPLEMSVEEDIKVIEDSLSILNHQLIQCKSHIEQLCELRKKVEHNPTEYFRSAFSCNDSIPLPTPISTHQIPTHQLSSLGGVWDQSSRIESMRRSSVSLMPAKISVKKARRLPGSRMLQKQKIDFARDWKDDDEKVKE